jgi:putative ABC transport system permease protein
MKTPRDFAARLRTLFQNRKPGAGVAPGEARPAARRQFGSAGSIKETCREHRGIGWIQDLLQDIRFGWRMLWRTPGFTAVAVLTLALGVGATTAIFSVVNTVLLNPVPGPDAERLIQISERTYIRGGFKEQNNKPVFSGVSPPCLEALLVRQDFFSALAWIKGESLERKTEDFIEYVSGAGVSANFFALWNIRPLLGRTFAKDEAGSPVIVVSHEFWRSHLGGEEGAVGRTIELSGRRWTVIGVMPPHFQFPEGYTRFWLPAEPTGPNTRLLARLKSGTARPQVQGLLDTISAQLMNVHGAGEWSYGREWRRRPQGLGFWVRPLAAEFGDGYESADLRRTLFGLLGGIGFVLLIVCANLANLTLARTERRQQELAVRSALGAGRWRLARQLLAENLLLACLAGLAGAAVTAWGMDLLVSLIPQSLPRLKQIHLDIHLLGFTLLASAITGLVFGLAPAWHAGRARLNEALKQVGTAATAGPARGRYRGALVVIEVALTLVLLTGAGLMVQSVVRLLKVNPGFDPQNLLLVYLPLPWGTYNDQEHPDRARDLRKLLFTRLHDRLASLPGVKAVGFGKHGAWPTKLNVQDRAEQFEVLLDGCGVEEGDLFRAMRMPLRAGRYFERTDLGEAAGTAIINEAMERLIWPGENALGKRFDVPGAYAPGSYEVVGVVGDIRDSRYGQEPRPAFYRPCHELHLEGLAPFLVVRTDRDPRALLPAIRKELKAAEPGMTMPGITVARQVLYDSTQAQRTYMYYLVAFAGAGLLLSVIGIYGVLAYSVARRTRELGIRMALGAKRRQVLGLVITEGARLVIRGIVLGLIAAFWLTRLLRSQLFEVSPADPLVFTGVVLLLAAVALVACLLPAVRAMRIDPMTALRYE